MARHRLPACAFVALVVLLLSLACGALARALNAEVGEVKTERKVFNDPDGGVAPFEKRLAAAQAKAAPRVAIVLVEAECRKNKDTECKQLKELKVALKKGDKKADDYDYEEEEKPKKIEAPCKQSVFWSYFLGSGLCLPTTSFDVKPAPKKEEAKKKD